MVSRWRGWFGVGLVFGGSLCLRAESKGVESAQLVTYVEPVLPAGAEVKPFSSVSFVASLGTDGKLHDLVPVAAEGELTAAARDAAMQWVYTPYKCKGQPFERAFT